MTQENLNPEDDRKRTIVLIYGILPDGQPFWLYAAVRSLNYQAFQDIFRAGKLDIHHFDPFGELIVIGKGKSPPDSVTLKVAEVYQTSVETLMGTWVDAPE